jgi:hypothetical protein
MSERRIENSVEWSQSQPPVKEREKAGAGNFVVLK